MILNNDERLFEDLNQKEILNQEQSINEKFIQEIALAILEYCKNNDFDICGTT